MAWARFAARMCGSKTLMSTEMPTAFPAQMVPTVAIVDRPFSNVCPLSKNNTLIRIENNDNVFRIETKISNVINFWSLLPNLEETNNLVSFH